MKTFSDLEICLHRTDGNGNWESREVVLKKGTQVVEWVFHGEEVFLIRSGEWKDWFFVASPKWASKNLGGEEWATSRSGYGE